MSVDRESQARQYVEEIVGLYVQPIGLTLEEVRKAKLTVVIRARTSSWSTVAVPTEVTSLVRELSPKSLGIQGIELSYYPDLSSHMDGNQPYRTDLTIAARLPVPTIPEHMREIVAMNQVVQARFGWQYGILPNETPPMDRILFDSNVSPMRCGVLGSGFSMLPLTGQIEFEQRARRIVEPELVALVAESLAQFQLQTRYDSKTVAVL